jgi:hypothetical protein
MRSLGDPSGPARARTVGDVEARVQAGGTPRRASVRSSERAEVVLPAKYARCSDGVNSGGYFEAADRRVASRVPRTAG